MFEKFNHLPPIWKNPSRHPAKFYCLHQRWIPPLNNNFHVINQKKLHFFLYPMLLYYFHFTLVLFANIPHSNFNFNQFSIFIDCWFKLWKSFEWSLLLRFSSTHKTIPFPRVKFIIPLPLPSNVYAIWKTLSAFQSGRPT